MKSAFHLAQVNIGRLRAPIDDPIMDGFRTQLDPINALADRSPGSSGGCRPKTATPRRSGRTPTTTAWRSTCRCGNRSRRCSSSSIGARTWDRCATQAVVRTDRGPILVLWWVPAGHIPTIAEAKERLDHLKAHGPSPEAFTFRTPFPAPDGKSGDVAGLDAAFCEWAT